jgi:protein TonB
MAFVAVPPAPPPPPPPPPPPAPTVPQPVVQNVNPNAAPIEAPKDIVFDPPPPPPPPSLSMAGAVGGVPGGIPGGTPGGMVGGIPPAPPPPTAPVRPGGNIKEPEKKRHVPPVYPQIAQTAKVSGVVILEAIITKEGTVRDVKVLRSVPLLDQAAIEAVRQWRYTPTTLNGIPVEVIMTVTVNFTLN